MNFWLVFSLVCIFYAIGFGTGSLYGQAKGIKWVLDQERAIADRKKENDND